jgi:hypothetical protein
MPPHVDVRLLVRRITEYKPKEFDGYVEEECMPSARRTVLHGGSEDKAMWWRGLCDGDGHTGRPTRRPLILGARTCPPYRPAGRPRPAGPALSVSLARSRPAAVSVRAAGTATLYGPRHAAYCLPICPGRCTLRVRARRRDALCTAGRRRSDPTPGLPPLGRAGSKKLSQSDTAGRGDRRRGGTRARDERARFGAGTSGLRAVRPLPHHVRRRHNGRQVRGTCALVVVGRPATAGWWARSIRFVDPRIWPPS